MCDDSKIGLPLLLKHKYIKNLPLLCLSRRIYTKGNCISNNIIIFFFFCLFYLTIYFSFDNYISPCLFGFFVGEWFWFVFHKHRPLWRKFYKEKVKSKFPKETEVDKNPPSPKSKYTVNLAEKPGESFSTKSVIIIHLL